MSRGRLVPAILILLVALPAASAQAADCTRSVNDVRDFGPALKEAVTLSPEKGSEQRLVNFDSNRGVKKIRNVRFVTDKRLPNALKASQLGFDALVERAGDKLETIDFTDPTFSEPRFSADRRHIAFDVCLSASGLGPGKYVGNITLTGPEGLGDGRAGITANLKAKLLVFAIAALVAVLVAGAALYLKDHSANPAVVNSTWWYKTGGTLLVTLGVLSGVYYEDPAWGAGTIQTGIALIGTALAAVGGRKLLD